MVVINFRLKGILTFFIIISVPGFAVSETILCRPEMVRDWQSCLEPDEVMLEYILLDSSVQINSIARESYNITIQSLDPGFWSNLECFRKKLKSADPKDFQLNGEILYQFLVTPIQNIIAGKHRLIIIPDNRIAAVPFEAFIRISDVETGGNRVYPHYLIHDFEVVYHISASLWYEQGRITEKKINYACGNMVEFIGVSPASSKCIGVAPLPGARSEIGEIGELFHQKALSTWLMTEGYLQKERFMFMASCGRIIHLATHYFTEKPGCRTGGFLFAGYLPANGKSLSSVDLLTPDELFMMQLQADLVVLSACASGVDRINTGNSIGSLPQLLFLAGARNVLSTLWNVTDNLTKHFMLDFYRLCLSGKTYSEALREVKLQWISCRETAIPTIWAPYVLMGD
jgi:CHAT domain-containing protein